MGKKKRYNLSPEGLEKLNKRLAEAVTEFDTESEEPMGLQEAQISTAFVRKLTKVTGIEDVIERNSTLSKTYSGFTQLYGFESLLDMYVYAMSCDGLTEMIRKGKDYSKLVPVQRKVIRNGKETTITVYEDPNKGDDKDKKDSAGSGAARGRGAKGGKATHARDLTSAIIRDDKTANPKEVAKLKTAAKGLQGKPFSDHSDFYLTIKGEGGELVGIIGYSVDGDFMVMDFYQTNGQVAGVATKGFFELVKLAHEKGKGVRVEDILAARPVFAKMGLEQNGDYWEADHDHLKKVMTNPLKDSE